MLLLALMLYGLIALFIWHEIDAAHKKHQARKNRRIESFTVNNARHNTQKLSQMLNNTPKDKPYIPVRTIHKFDRKLYDEIMAQDEKPILSEKPMYQPKKHTENEDFLSDLIDKIVLDNTIKTTNTEAFHGPIMRRIAIASKKPTLDKPITESISVKASFICDKCGYKANSKWGMYGHRKAHSKK